MTDDQIYLQDICDRLNRIEVYTQGGKDEVWNVVVRDIPNLKLHILEILSKIA
jgi:uncharacterized protein with HEPN domain